MKPEEFLPLFTKQQDKLAKLKLEYNVRLNSLILKNNSSTHNKKYEEKNNSIDYKLEQLNQEKNKTINYYENEIKNAERKFEEYKQYCMKQMESIREKYDIKVEALENKKDNNNNDFDEESDTVLNKKREEIKAQDDIVSDYKATYERFLAEEKNRQIKERKENEYLNYLKEKESRLREEQIQEAKAYQTLNQRIEESEKKIIQEETTNENIKAELSKHKKILDKELPSKLFNKYMKLTQDKKTLLLHKPIQYIIDYLS